MFQKVPSRIPGPRRLPIFGNALQIDRSKMHLNLHAWANTYGGIYSLGLPMGETIVVSDYKLIRKILVEDGARFAGRLGVAMDKNIELGSSVLGLQPGETWRHIRKLSHRYMKQFGDGLSRMEEILLGNADHMVGEFDENIGQPIDSLDIIKGTALRSISALLLGRSLESSEPLLDMMLKYESDFLRITEITASQVLLDLFPWLINAPVKAFEDIRNFKKFQEQCWQEVKKMQSEAQAESLTQVLMKDANKESQIGSKAPPILEELHAKMSSLVLIIAGVATTSRSLHFILNTLAFRKEIQDKVHSEVSKVLAQDGTRRVTVAHRPEMPYLRATILECLRMFNVIPIGVAPHSPVVDVELPGYGVIPKGTPILVNTWSLHHDEGFWQDPDTIRPERFLDEEGQLVPPDHPNRKHLLPFGAGPRVCLGEVFAMTRLFLWTAAVIGKFEITPAPGSDENWLNPNVHKSNFVIIPRPNKVVFARRN